MCIRDSLLDDAVPFLELLLSAHAQRLVGDLFEVTLPGEEEVHRVIGCVVLLDLLGLVARENENALPGLAVLLDDLAQLRNCLLYTSA